VRLVEFVADEVAGGKHLVTDRFQQQEAKYMSKNRKRSPDKVVLLPAISG
jgi:hypothetical protein